MVKIATNEAKNVGDRGNIIQAMIPMIATNSTKPITPHSTSCWIYQLSGM